MILSQYIEPEVVDVYRPSALVTVEVRTEDAGVVVDSRMFGRGERAIPLLGDNVRLSVSKENCWDRASFVLPGEEGSLMDPSDLVISGHAGRRIVTVGQRKTGTITEWSGNGIVALMDDGDRRSFPSFDHPRCGWDLLIRFAPCCICGRTVSIYTPMLLCGACAASKGW